MSEGSLTKHCPTCGQTKTVERFARNQRRKDGLAGWCKDCNLAAYLARRPADHVHRPVRWPRNVRRADAWEKRCQRRGLIKLIDELGVSRREPDGRTSWCKPCKAEYDRQRLQDAAVRDRQRRGHREWYTRNREAVLAKTRTANEALRAEVLAAYGHRCQCCGEATSEFLGIDHINGGGRQHRRMTGEGRRFYLWLKRHGFPRNEFRLLCHNCSLARGHYGYCPHERAGGSLA